MQTLLSSFSLLEGSLEVYASQITEPLSPRYLVTVRVLERILCVILMSLLKMLLLQQLHWDNLQTMC